MHWKRKLGSRLSPEIDAILRPSSEKKAIIIIRHIIIITLIINLPNPIYNGCIMTMLAVNLL